MPQPRFTDFQPVTMLVVMSIQQASVFLKPDPTGVLSQRGTRWAVLLLHGFTAGPASVLPWGRALASAGASVHMPLLAGHGTTVADLASTTARQWRQDVQQHLDSLRAGPYDAIAVGGLSMGGTLALDAAAHRNIDMTFVVNPGLSFKKSNWPGVFVTPLIHRIVPTVGPLAGDVKKPGVVESAYDRTPVSAVEQLARLFATVRSKLPQISSPVVLYQSRTDHVVPPSSSRILQRGVNPALLSKVRLARSYHVATLDYDAERIQNDSIARLRAVSGGSHAS